MKRFAILALLLGVIAIALPLLAQSPEADYWNMLAARLLSEYLKRPVSPADFGNEYSVWIGDGACAEFLQDDSLFSLNNVVMDFWGYYGNLYRVYADENGLLCGGETLDEPNPLPEVTEEPTAVPTLPIVSVWDTIRVTAVAPELRAP